MTTPEPFQTYGPATEPIQPPDNSKFTKRSCLQSIREQGISEKASELLLVGWSTGPYISQGGHDGGAGVVNGKFMKHPVFLELSGKLILMTSATE